SRWIYSIGLTDIPNELLYSQTNPTGGGFLCPQRHSKVYFQLPECFRVTENPSTAVGRIILHSRIISGFLNQRLNNGQAIKLKE
ncbi:hypothetical protein, partial [Bacteroides acidifaciens]|uniref:hypothetical protein n=1 Tax=Bacteroides acidifaciens TaxID=85831 RepID=UPI002593F3F3